MRTFKAAHEQAWLSRVNHDPEFKLVSRWTDLRLTLVSGAQSRSYRIRPTTFEIDERADGASPEVVLVGSSEAWTDFLQPIPPPHGNHVLAMDRRRDDFEVAAGREELIRHLRVLDLILQLMRPATSGAEGMA